MARLLAVRQGRVRRLSLSAALLDRADPLVSLDAACRHARAAVSDALRPHERAVGTFSETCPYSLAQIENMDWHPPRRRSPGRP